MTEEIPEGEKPDDPSIDGRVKVLRRVPPGRFSPVTGLPESSTFDKDGADYPGTSITLWVNDEDLEIVTAPHPTFGVVAVFVEQLREEELRVAYIEEEGNPNHCEIFGPRSSGKKKRLARATKWVKYPEDFPDELKGGHPLWVRDAD